MYLLGHLLPTSMLVSLGTPVPNIVGIDMKKWRQNFMHYKTHSKMCFVWEKQPEMIMIMIMI